MGSLALRSRGDTIVEVLLAIVIVSTVIAGAFVSASQSQQGSRTSQERGEALKLLQGQLETLKEAAKQDPSAVYSGSVNFCFSGATVNPQSAPCSAGTDGRYKLTVNRNSSGGEHTFTALARWDRFGGGEQQQIDIVYRVYQ